MKNLLKVIILGTVVLITTASYAAEAPVTLLDDGEVLMTSKDNGAALALAGYDPEKGVFELFVHNSRSNLLEQDALASDLNAIEPSVGVKFNLDF